MMHTASTRPALRIGSVLTACTLGVLLTGTAGAAPKPTPPGQSGGNGQSTDNSSSNGNSGTIKVAFPNANTDPNNDAKPGCTVRLDFFGFRRGTYHAEFRAIAPTGDKRLASGNVTVTQPRTPASAFQTSGRFFLDVFGLQPDKAGYHVNVKVTNTANPDGGAKSKNFTFDCVPGGQVRFSGGSGSTSVVRSGSGAGNVTGGSGSVGAVPRGGFATGAGGTAPDGPPLLPIAGLLAGLSLVGAGALRRKQV